MFHHQWACGLVAAAITSMEGIQSMFWNWVLEKDRDLGWGSGGPRMECFSGPEAVVAIVVVGAVTHNGWLSLVSLP